MRPIRIQDRHVGDEHPVLVIAEIGVNHDGSEARAIDLVHVAKRAGADAVKLQLFSADRLVEADTATAAYQQRACDADDQRELLRRLELPIESVRRVVGEARALGLVPLATPFSIEDVETIRALDLPAVKIASPDLINKPLLRRAASLGVPVILSTGACTHEEIVAAIDWMDPFDVARIVLHCVSNYPTAAVDANLSWIQTLRESLGVAVGFSDHCESVLSGALATAAGACVVEKHLTYDCTAAGPDHAASFDEAEFAEYVRLIRLAERMRGGGERRVLDVEKDVRTLSRQSLIAGRSIRSGERISWDDLATRRPADGMSPVRADEIVGQIATCAIAAGTRLQPEMFARETRKAV